MRLPNLYNQVIFMLPLLDFCPPWQSLLNLVAGTLIHSSLSTWRFWFYSFVIRDVEPFIGHTNRAFRFHLLPLFIPSWNPSLCCSVSRYSILPRHIRLLPLSAHSIVAFKHIIKTHWHVHAVSVQHIIIWMKLCIYWWNRAHIILCFFYCGKWSNIR